MQINDDIPRQISSAKFDRRRAIRETWASVGILRNVSFQRLFLLGITSSHIVQNNVIEASRLHDDIFQISFMDDFYNITLKTTGIIKWMTMYCHDADYAMFVDDDFYVNTYEIRSLLDTSDKVNVTFPSQTILLTSTLNLFRRDHG